MLRLTSIHPNKFPFLAAILGGMTGAIVMLNVPNDNAPIEFFDKKIENINSGNSYLAQVGFFALAGACFGAIAANPQYGKGGKSIFKIAFSASSLLSLTLAGFALAGPGYSNIQLHIHPVLNKIVASTFAGATIFSFGWLGAIPFRNMFSESGPKID
jgi:hypothetical protein